MEHDGGAEAGMEEILDRVEHLAFELQESADRVDDEDVYHMCDLILLLKGILLEVERGVKRSNQERYRNEFLLGIIAYQAKISDGLTEAERRQAAALGLAFAVVKLAQSPQSASPDCAGNEGMESVEAVWRRLN